ncbi:MAG: hypothetical protein RRB13_15895 [bacterium]|nr:hypothetical protein [bacterium]
MKGILKALAPLWGRLILPVCLALLPGVAHAQMGLDFLVQESRWTIDALSEQKSASQTGAYLYFPLGPWAYLEASHDETTIEFKTADPFKRGDNAGVLSLLLGPMTLYGGQHQVATETSSIQGGKSSVVGAELFDILHLTLRYESYRTSYPDFPLSDQAGITGLELSQSSPMIGVALFEGLLDLEVQRDVSQTNDSLGLGQTEFVSTRQALRLTFYPWRFYASKWSGERLFFASSKGLYLNSMDLLYKGGNQGSFTYYGFDWVHIGYTRTVETFLEAPQGDPLTAHIDTLSLTLRF